MASGSVIGRNGSSDKAGVVAGRQSFFRKMTKQTSGGDSVPTNSGIAAFWLFNCPILKGPDYKRAVAVLLVLAMLIVPITSTISFTGGEGADNSVYNYSQSTVTYYKDSSKTESVTLSYDGTPIAEYNPESWGVNGTSSGTKQDGTHLSSNDQWMGSTTTATIIYELEVSWSWTPLTGVSKIDILIPDGWTVYYQNNVYTQDTLTVHKERDTWGYSSGSVELTLTCPYEVKSVFGGWVEDPLDNGYNSIIHPGSELKTGTVLYANWIAPTLYSNLSYARIDNESLI